MNITIRNAQLEQVPEPDKGYIGKVELVVEGHAEPYEVTLFTKRGKEWDYSLHFLNEPGKEEEILALETLISEDDDTFDRIIDAVWDFYEANEENPASE
ncbi:hypothetical protein PQ460_18395 [Paenibacillus sp. KACC 21273]|uniref:hypothetical protein n=1 Tax=Paenibacillus sp. KACC 21273 TaxID=3025665 RepID=UPI00236720F2|nr:hypothetical protein [Paenibacillus sp. KACC 21273]WDF49942.1 hypothetical protein PQ460_18395 [Paenibacillus sp. KACC 21273]